MAPKLRRPTGYGSSFSLLISDLYFVVALATHYDAHHAHWRSEERVVRTASHRQFNPEPWKGRTSHLRSQANIPFIHCL